jgi:hypothetical protein
VTSARWFLAPLNGSQNGCNLITLLTRQNEVQRGSGIHCRVFGTMVLILFGCGSVVMAVILAHTNPTIPSEVVKGGYTNIVFGWG